MPWSIDHKPVTDKYNCHAIIVAIEKKSNDYQILIVLPAD